MEVASRGKDIEIVAGLSSEGAVLFASEVGPEIHKTLYRSPPLTAEEARELARELEAVANELDRR